MSSCCDLLLIMGLAVHSFASSFSLSARNKLISVVFFLRLVYPGDAVVRAGICHLGRRVVKSSGLLVFISIGLKTYLSFFQNCDKAK